MTDTRTLKTIVRNMIQLYIKGAYEDLRTYQEAIREGLNMHDLASVKQAYQDHLNTRS